MGRSSSSSSSGSSSDSDGRDRRHRKDKKRKKEKHRKKKSKKEQKEKKRKRTRDDGDRYEIEPPRETPTTKTSSGAHIIFAATDNITRALDRREKEILAQAKKYLRQQGLAPSGAGGIEAAAAAVSAASKSSTYGAIGNTNDVGGVDQGTLSAAALAAKRVAEARASALEEDALYARMGGAPREGLLDFRTRGVDSVALGADGAGGEG